MTEQRKINIICDGTTYSFPAGTAYRDIVREIPCEKEALLVLEGNSLRELRHTADKDAQIRLITFEDDAGYKAYVRSLILLLCAAMDKICPNDERYLLSVHFVAGKGLYCTIMDDSCMTDSFLEKVGEEMHLLVRQQLPILKYNVGTDEAISIFHAQKMFDKEQLFKYRRSSRTNLYELDGYRDYHYGYMVDNTEALKEFSLQRYDQGFILCYPLRSTSHHRKKNAVPERKLFSVQCASEAWGRSMKLRDVGDLNDRIVEGDSAKIIRAQEAFQEMKIAEIAAAIAKDPRKKIIMIAGPSSSGKTTFSHRLSTQLTVQGLNPHPIPVDDYFVNRENTPRHPDGSFNFECLEAIDIKQFNEDMTGLLEGRNVELPTFNFKTGKREYKEKYLQLQPDDVLVIEGIHCLNDALSYSLPHENKFKIYISALTQLRIDEHNRISTTDGRLLRRIIRDARTRGTCAAETIAMWPSVRMGEENYIFPYQESADVMFNSALIYELAVLKVYAEPLLFGIAHDRPEYIEAKRLLKFLDYFVPMGAEQIPLNSLLREFVGGSCFNV
ncbi:MAG: nucleoside kinase [Lachnospiraceae bacterium]|nr:nucleoside kinase [Lachnospiraceae bacterium]